ncbi:Uncharacterized protein M6B38_224520 [Iris pallida]|uniref:Large ribosomal subunit protein bL12 C-terminal domain-containing protein n=1 Tax=Iris pallida TaxID=29817 RepID=A0AAX6DVP8_IRIPA|nr:Uncharacterized protein M6B38_224520 [Iris pallida]
MMSSLLRSTRHLLSLHRHSSPYLRRAYSTAEAAEEAQPIDQRSLPADYDPTNPDLSAPPPTPRVWRLVDEVTSLTLADIADLTQILVAKSGIPEIPPIGVMGAGSSSASSSSSPSATEDKKAAAKEEKTVFELKLEGFDASSKIKVIKEVRAFTDLGLKEAKELVEKAPVVIKGGFSKEEGMKIVEKMTAVGAKVVLE